MCLAWYEGYNLSLPLGWDKLVVEHAQMMMRQGYRSPQFNRKQKITKL